MSSDRFVPRGSRPVQRYSEAAEFQEAASHAFVPLQISTRTPHRFHATTHAVEFPECSVVEISSEPHVVERTRRLVEDRDAEPSYKVSLQLEGTAYICQDGRDVLLGPGDIAVYDTTRPYTLAFDDPSRMIITMFPKRLLGLPEGRVAKLTASSLGHDEELGTMVSTMLTSIAGRLDHVGAPIGQRLARNAIDLVSILLRDELDGEPASPREELLEAILDHIERRLGDPQLSPGTIAAAHYISVRYLHALFQGLGTSVSTHIRQRRLERCREDLVDPALAGETVMAIAARWTFTDAAHFSRIFKAAFQLTPSEARAQALSR